jgi:hypothetical protein
MGGDFAQRRDALLAELQGTPSDRGLSGSFANAEDDELASEELSTITSAPQAPGPLP